MHFKDLVLGPPNFQTWRRLGLKPISPSGFRFGFGSGFFSQCNLCFCLFLKWKYQVLFGPIVMQKHHYLRKVYFLWKPFWQRKLSCMAPVSIQTITAVLIGDIITECIFSKLGAWVSLRCLLFVLKMAFQKPFLSFMCAISVTQWKNTNTKCVHVLMGGLFFCFGFSFKKNPHILIKFVK